MCVKGIEQKVHSFYPCILSVISIYFLRYGNQSIRGWKNHQNRGLLTHHETYDKNEESIFGCVHNTKREKITLNNKRQFS